MAKIENGANSFWSSVMIDDSNFMQFTANAPLAPAYAEFSISTFSTYKESLKFVFVKYI
jgi:hypothetical protein